jgi:hypothetical protein
MGENPLWDEEKPRAYHPFGPAQAELPLAFEPNLPPTIRPRAGRLREPQTARESGFPVSRQGLRPQVNAEAAATERTPSWGLRPTRRGLRPVFEGCGHAAPGQLHGHGLGAHQLPTTRASRPPGGWATRACARGRIAFMRKEASARGGAGLLVVESRSGRDASMRRSVVPSGAINRANLRLWPGPARWSSRKSRTSSNQ